MADHEYKVRLWAKTKIAGPDECWEWQGYVMKNGYGTMSFKGATTVVHRLSVLFSGRQLPAGMDVDHLCRNRRCLNPKHLEVVTRSENARRGLAPLILAARAAAVTHCPAGHEYSDDNTYRDKRGKRQCRKCSRARDRSHKAKPEVKARAIQLQRERRARNPSPKRRELEIARDA